MCATCLVRMMRPKGLPAGGGYQRVASTRVGKRARDIVHGDRAETAVVFGQVQHSKLGTADSHRVFQHRAFSGRPESISTQGDFQTAANQIRSSLPATARAIMAKGYSTDLRVRVVALVEAGDSRREVGR